MTPLTLQDREWVTAVIESTVAKAMIEFKDENAKLREELIATTRDLSKSLEEYVHRQLKECQTTCRERQYGFLQHLIAGAVGGLVVGAATNGHNIFSIIQGIIRYIFS